MADADILQTRKGHTHSHTDEESTTVVPIVESHSDVDQYPNPFQQHVGQAHGRNRNQQQQQHYNVMIPTVDHWPAIFLDALKTSAHFAVFGLKLVHAKWQQFQSSRSGGSYQVLPTTTNLDIHSPNQQQPNARQKYSFGSKRQQKGGHQFSFSGRRLTRLLFVLVLVVTTVLLLVLPHRLNPLNDRVIWIRFYSHEEAIKIKIPYGRKVHVSDIKKVALREMHQGFSNFAPGNVKLITRDTRYNDGTLKPDEVWDNRDWTFESSARHPILVIDTKSELFQFLDGVLQCFAPPEEYALQGRNQYSVTFAPWNNNYTRLAHILDNIANNMYMSIEEEDIFYLREAFNDPRKNEPRTGQRWKISPNNKSNYIVPDIGYIPQHTALSIWDDKEASREFENDIFSDFKISPRQPQHSTWY